MQIYFQISDTNLKKCVRVGGIKNENAFCDQMVCRERDGMEKRRCRELWHFTHEVGADESIKA